MQDNSAFWYLLSRHPNSDSSEKTYITRTKLSPVGKRNGYRPPYLKDVAILYLVLHGVVFCHDSTHDGIPEEKADAAERLFTGQIPDQNQLELDSKL